MTMKGEIQQIRVTVKFLPVNYIKRQSNNIWFVSVNKIIHHLSSPTEAAAVYNDLKFTELATYFEDVYLPLFAFLGRRTNLFGCPLLPLNTVTAPKSDGFYIFFLSTNIKRHLYLRVAHLTSLLCILYLPYTHILIVNGWRIPRAV